MQASGRGNRGRHCAGAPAWRMAGECARAHPGMPPSPMPESALPSQHDESSKGEGRNMGRAAAQCFTIPAALFLRLKGQVIAVHGSWVMLYISHVRA